MPSWFEGDWKKAPNLAQMLFRASKTNLEGVPKRSDNPGGQYKHFIFGTFCKLESTFCFND